MIAVIDFYRLEDEHLAVNAALLFIISEQYKNEKVHFYAEDKHIANIRKYWCNNNLEVSNVTFYPSVFRYKKGSGATLVFKRMMHELVSFTGLVFKKHSKEIDNYFFLSLSPLTTIFIKLFLSGKVQALITLHGEVDFTRLNNSFTRNILGRLVRISFKIKRKNLHYLVLDEVIKTNLLLSRLLEEKEVLAIPHPYFYKNERHTVSFTMPFKVAHIGVASIEKQSFYFFRLAEECKELIQSKKIELLLIGKNETAMSSELVYNSGNKEMLDREVFEFMINDIHFAVFFYNDVYQFTSSGAVLDALNFEKPVIALKNSLFNAIFERAGNIGFLCEDIAGIKKIIEDIASGGISLALYQEMQLNMQRYKDNNSLENIRLKLFSQLNVNMN